MKAPLALLLLGAALLASHSAEAAPRAALPVDASDAIIRVKDGCGVGFHRLSSGVCRPEPKGPKLMQLFARKCQLGYRRNLLGKCVKD
jgi:hypothetical protein